MRILIVLGLPKQAMGTSSVPPPQVITALAIFMTLLVMAPTIDRINKEAIAPYRAGEVQSYDELWNRAKQPPRDFMFNQIEASGNWSSLYMILANYDVVPFTGKNAYLFGLDSLGDVMEALVLLMIAVAA